MAFSAETHPTLRDVANVNQADGTIADVVEMLMQQYEILTDMVLLPSNEPSSHRHTIRTGLPSGVWRGYNVGVPSSKSQTATVIDTIGNYESFATVDKDLVDLNGNSAAWRLQEEKSFRQTMMQTMAKQLIYGNEASEPEGFTGIMPRYSTVSTSTSESADNVIDAGGTGGDNASILLVTWDPSSAFGIYPKGQAGGDNMAGGLSVRDLGEQVLQNVATPSGGTNGTMLALQTHYKWELGFSLRDWRYCGRIANIDKSDLSYDGASGAKLTRYMFELAEVIPEQSMGRMAFYMSRNVRTKLFQQLAEGVKSSTLTIDMVGGVRTPMFMGIPIRRVDAMAMDEARVT